MLKKETIRIQMGSVHPCGIPLGLMVPVCSCSPALATGQPSSLPCLLCVHKLQLQTWRRQPYRDCLTSSHSYIRSHPYNKSLCMCTYIYVHIWRGLLQVWDLILLWELGIYISDEPLQIHTHILNILILFLLFSGYLTSLCSLQHRREKAKIILKHPSLSLSPLQLTRS